MKKTWLLAAAAGLAVSTGASAQVFNNTTPLTLPDNPTVSSVINVGGSGPASITDLNVIIRITHTFDGDLDIVLQGPGGYVTLTTDNGSSGDNYITTRFDDLSTTSITSGTAPFNNNYKPEATFNGWAGTPATFTGTSYATLAGFNGTNAQSTTWTLWIDDDAGGDTGTLSYWSLEFNGATDTEGPTPLGSPTNPLGTGTVTPAAAGIGSSANFRVTVTPGTFPNSTWGNPGTGVSVDGSAAGLGSITLFDDGAHNDGGAGDNIWGVDYVIPNTATLGAYVFPFSILDNQGRSGTGNMPNFTIIGAPPSCPEGNQAASFTNIASYDGLNAAGNTTFSLPWTGSDLVSNIHVSGRLFSQAAATYASEARFLVTFSDASTVTLQPSANAATFSYEDITDYVFTLPAPKAATGITIQAYESFNDATAANDSVWSNLCFTFDPQLSPTNPTGVGSATPGSGTIGANTTLRVVVTPGVNPTSTFANPGSGVSVDASAIDAGTVTLFDDGMHNDGGAGDGTWANSATVGAGAAGGAQTLSFTITDDQARNGTGTFGFTVVPPPPACPSFNSPVSFTDLISYGPAGDANNSVSPVAFTGSGVVTHLHLSGRQDTDAATGSFSSESRIKVNFSDSTSQLWQPIAAGSGSDLFDVADSVLALTTPRAPSEIVSIETYDSFDDPGQDAVWLNLCLAWESRSTNPTGVGSHGTPAACFGFVDGEAVQLNVVVTNGANPTGTYANPGSGVSVDASLIGGGTVALFDDGMHNDGGAGDNNWGGTATVTAATNGTYTLTFAIADDQGRSGSGNIAGVVVGNGGGAGPLLANAVDLTTNQVTGSFDTGAYLWRINICDPANFSASTFNAATTADTQLFLFDASGNALAMNDDAVGGVDLNSALSNAFVTSAGTYYLALAGYDYDPIGTNCLALWLDTPFRAERGPDGTGTGPLSGWEGTNTNLAEPFELNVTGVCFGVPGLCEYDLNGDGNVDQADVDCMIAAVAGDPSCVRNDVAVELDKNQDGNIDQGDVDTVVDVIAGGQAPGC